MKVAGMNFFETQHRLNLRSVELCQLYADLTWYCRQLCSVCLMMIWMTSLWWVRGMTITTRALKCKLYFKMLGTEIEHGDMAGR